MLLTVTNVTKTFGLQPVLKDVSFVLNVGQRAGLVGANGSGKSTLLKIIVGQVEAESGEVAIKSGLKVGYLPQSLPDVPGQTIADLLNETLDEISQLEARMRELEQRMGESGPDLAAVMEEYGSVSERFEHLGGYDINHRVDEVFGGLRIAYLAREREVSTLSGGEKSRVALAAMLIGSPDLLLLDEPTNHLDFLSMQWLEGYLRQYKGALLAVSHDRTFLNHTADVILEIDDHSRELKR
ncbi:MAG: ABC-F family ATP-binding cassette domain-containing protein, partial [Burkholderiales bacterium]|nr:ABC-F family ATP-binding cassette domain-containing protein [Anaerolineae bacterium]